MTLNASLCFVFTFGLCFQSSIVWQGVFFIPPGSACSTLESLGFSSLALPPASTLQTSKSTRSMPEVTMKLGSCVEYSAVVQTCSTSNISSNHDLQVMIFHLHSFASSASKPSRFQYDVTLMSWCRTSYSRLTVRSAAKWSGGCGSCWTRWSQRTLNPQYHSNYHHLCHM